MQNNLQFVIRGSHYYSFTLEEPDENNQIFNLKILILI